MIRCLPVGANCVILRLLPVPPPLAAAQCVDAVSNPLTGAPCFTTEDEDAAGVCNGGMIKDDTLVIVLD